MNQHRSFWTSKAPSTSSSSSNAAGRTAHDSFSRRRRMHGSYPDEPSNHAPSTSDPSFDVLEWHPAYLSCIRYFLDHAQHEPATQALCALINIRLPFQWFNNPITSSHLRASTPNTANSSSHPFNTYPRNTNSSSSTNNNFSPRPHDPTPTTSALPISVSLVPYLRRLIVTAFDKPAILHGFFGDDYVQGVMPHVECERRNYLFAAKHGGWRSCKKQYDTGSGGGGPGDESVPFMKPLDEATAEELMAADRAWSSWLCMEDWMVGPRAPEGSSVGSSQRQQQQQPQQGMGQRQEMQDLMPDGVPEEFRDGMSPGGHDGR